MRLRTGWVILVVGALALAVVSIPSAGADPVDTASASAFTVSASLAGAELIPPTPEVSITLPPGGDVSDTSIPLDVSPVAVNGTLNARAKAHADSDIASELTVNPQAIAGPYNATGVASVEELDVLVDVVDVGVSVLSAAAVRAEAAAVCVGGEPQYTANSEIIDLDVAGTDVPLNGPIEQLIGIITDLIEALGIEDVVDLDLNVVTPLEGGGITVDALRVDVLAVLGDPLISLVIGHAEVGPISCAAQENPGQVVKAGPPEVVAGESFDYTITVTNVSDRCDLTAVRVTDTIQGPAGTQVTATSPQADSVSGEPQSGGIVLVWNDVGPIAAGQSRVLTATVRTPADAPAGTTYLDDAFAEYTCNGTPFEDTDRIEAPELTRTTARTGGGGAILLVAGAAGLLAAFGLRSLYRRATPV